MANDFHCMCPRGERRLLSRLSRRVGMLLVSQTWEGRPDGEEQFLAVLMEIVGD